MSDESVGDDEDAGKREDEREPLPKAYPGGPAAESTVRIRGIVKFFNAEKGFGFISRTEGDDVFVHYSSIVGLASRTLEEGQIVEFTVRLGRKGSEALSIRIV